MKTAISIPDQVFEAAESLAQRLGVSRSELYSVAVNEFINNNRNQGVTEKLDKVYSAQDNSLDEACYELQAKSIIGEDW